MITALRDRNTRKGMLIGALGAFGCMAIAAGVAPRAQDPATGPRLGNFSISLKVKSRAASQEFYEKLGFRKVFAMGEKLAIMQNDTATIGLFEGVIPANTLTFNPGWDRSMATLADFDDVRSIQRTLTERGLTLATRVDDAGTGPAGLTLYDPDGNQILIDQHVPKAGLAPAPAAKPSSK